MAQHFGRSLALLVAFCSAVHAAEDVHSPVANQAHACSVGSEEGSCTEGDEFTALQIAAGKVKPTPAATQKPAATPAPKKPIENKVLVSMFITEGRFLVACDDDRTCLSNDNYAPDGSNEFNVYLISGGENSQLTDYSVVKLKNSKTNKFGYCHPWPSHRLDWDGYDGPDFVVKKVYLNHDEDHRIWSGDVMYLTQKDGDWGRWWYDAPHVKCHPSPLNSMNASNASSLGFADISSSSSSSSSSTDMWVRMEIA